MKRPVMVNLELEDLPVGYHVAADYIQSLEQKLDAYRAKDIAKEMQQIFARCEHWKSCADGSYGLCLDSGGYHRLNDELAELGFCYRDGEAMPIGENNA